MPLLVSKPKRSFMQCRPVGTVSGPAGRTGADAGPLFGVFAASVGSRVEPIRTTNGSAPQTFTADPLAGTLTSFAFVGWGGDFLGFLQRASDPSAPVYPVAGRSGLIKRMAAANERS